MVVVVTGEHADEPDSTAVRVALWRAMHVEVDAAPHVIDDVVGLQLAAPDSNWRDRGDMHPVGTRGFRAAIVARARFIEDVVTEQAAAGVTQYVILGAGLDTLAQRRPDLGARLRIFEVDQPGTQAWKRRRLVDSRLAATGADRLREWGELVGRVVCRWLRARPSRDCRVHRCQHVPDQGSHGGRASPARLARHRLNRCHDVPAPS